MRRRKKGFTLAETLLAVLIMLLVSTIMATGIPAARNAYEKVVLGANAQMLLSTSLTSLRNELGTAKEVKVAADKKSVTYYSAKTQAYAKIYLDDASEIMIQDYISLGSYTAEVDHEGKRTHNLITDKASTDDLYVTFDTIETEGTKNNPSTNITVNDIQVKRINGSNILASLDKLDIRVLSENVQMVDE